MEFDNDTIFDIVECWKVGLLNLSVLEFSICRYCGMSKKKSTQTKFLILPTDYRWTHPSVNPFVESMSLPTDKSVSNYQQMTPSVVTDG